MSVFSYLYRRKAWRVLRAEHLRLKPFCVKCLEVNVHTLGNTVDHRTPHRGDMDLFFDKGNLQTLCHSHHSKDKQLEELYGYAPGVDEAGNPIDPNHPFNRPPGGDRKVAANANAVPLSSQRVRNSSFTGDNRQGVRTSYAKTTKNTRSK